ECFPAILSRFQNFNLSMARDSARNVSTRVPWPAAFSLLRSAPGLGLRLKTLAQLGSQVLTEQLEPWRKCRRRTYQAVLAFDVFLKQLRQTRPAFSTFFTNHVAASMHRYWAAAFPGDYDVFEYSDDWVRTYSREIEFAMTKFDLFLRDVLAFVDTNPGYTVWIASSMGQG